jgi:hypothetical protein
MPIDTESLLATIGEKWQITRTWIQENPAIVVVAAAIIMVISWGAIGCQLIGGSRPGRPSDRNLYYFDMNTGKIFLESAFEQPPVDAPSGKWEKDRPEGVPVDSGAGVRVYIFTCGECPAVDEGMIAQDVEKAGGFIGYYERYDTEMLELLAKARSGELNDPALAMPGRGVLVMSPDGVSVEELESDEDGILIPDGWHQVMSADGNMVLQHAITRCGDKKHAKACLPPK